MFSALPPSLLPLPPLRIFLPISSLRSEGRKGEACEFAGTAKRVSHPRSLKWKFPSSFLSVETDLARPGEGRKYPSLTRRPIVVQLFWPSL